MYEFKQSSVREYKLISWNCQIDHDHVLKENLYLAKFTSYLIFKF